MYFLVIRFTVIFKAVCSNRLRVPSCPIDYTLWWVYTYLLCMGFKLNLNLQKVTTPAVLLWRLNLNPAQPFGRCTRIMLRLMCLGNLTPRGNGKLHNSTPHNGSFCVNYMAPPATAAYSP